MNSLDDLRALLESDALLEIAAHENDDPAEYALARAGKHPHAALVATQIKYGKRARKKLPSWAASECLFPGRAYEQATSEAIAALKHGWEGARCLDLTMGLGVDTLHFARAFDRVVAVEPDPLLVACAEHNFRALATGACAPPVDRIEVVRATAEEYLDGYDGPPFDLVYVDPDRRDAAGKRVFSLGEGSPDVLTLAPKLLALAETVLVKASPMVDLDEAARVVPRMERTLVLADATECKEVLFELRGEGAPVAPDASVRSARFSFHGVPHEFTPPGGESASPSAASPPASSPPASPPPASPPALLDGLPGDGFLLEPNVAVYKAGLFDAYAAVRCRYPGARITAPGGYVHVPGHVPGFPGKQYRIEAAFPYRPAALRKELAKRGVRRLHFTRKRFDVSPADVRRALGVTEGGDRFLVLTEMPGIGRVAFLTAFESHGA